MSRRGGSWASQGITVREGTGERHWYFIAGYVAIAFVGVLYSLYAAMEFGGEVGGMTLGILFIVLAFGGLASFIALFKDSAYLRGTRAGWAPKWWHYIGIPVGIAVVSFFSVNAITTGDIAGAFALTLFGLAALVGNTWYLYSRHKYVGVP